MKYSVAMCTYNGSEFIQEQLSSILNQTLPVDEIVICDDGSSDNTRELIQTIQHNSNISIALYENPSNLGFKYNFFRAISLCSGDLVFLSDQDDVWHPTKVETIAQWFCTHPTYNVVFTDASLIDSKGENLDECLWSRFGFDKKKQRYFDHGYGLDIWAWSNRATGATMVFKKQFFDSINWEDSSDEYHDKIIALHGLINNCMGYIPKPLVSYRIHNNQSCGAKDLPRELHYTPLRPCPLSYVDFDYGCFPEPVKNHILFLQIRSLTKKQGVQTIFRNITRYIKEYRVWAYKFFLFDLFITMRHRVKVLFS